MLRKDIYVDARCLQDEAFRWRGVGQHSASLLRNGRQFLSATFDARFIAIVDRNLPDLTPEVRHLFDGVQPVGYVNDRAADCWFIQLSPMTHSPIHVARLLERGIGCSASVVYDFIPHEFPKTYLKDQFARLRYYNCMSWLKAYDLYLPISNYTRHRLVELIGIPPERSVTTGVAVRDSLLKQAEAKHNCRHVMAVGGGDWRKNIEAPVIAHARSRALNDAGIPLLVVGGYGPEMQAPLYRLHARHGGKRELLQFQPYVDDQALATLYQDAFVTVCPSRIEGFSIPIVEANANGSPVLVADCEAQRELVPFAEDSFGADDHGRLQRLIEGIALNPGVRESIRMRQEGIWQAYTGARVAERFWRPFVQRERQQPKSPRVAGKAKPKLAFVTPLPPDASGVADYSAACLEALAERAELHVFSDTENPRISPAYKSIQPISSVPYLSGEYDGVVSVIGNSHYHVSIFEKLLKHGSSCISHDARMINFYSVLYGQERACNVASRELGRPVAWEEVQSWTIDQSALPTLFLSEVAESSMPMMVHSRMTQKFVAEMYGREPVYLPFALYRDFRPSQLSNSARQQKRMQLGVAEDEVLLATFGMVGLDKAPEELVWTLDVLRRWGVNARLVFVGKAEPPVKRHLDWLICEIGIEPYVKVSSEIVSENDYRDYLVAADVGIQLRTYGLGGLSGSLLDCIAAVLPTVANAHLAQAMEAPTFVHAVPDAISPLLMAEKVVEILAMPRFDVSSLKEKRDFVAEHNFGVYSQRMLQALALA
jgi:glycosyltransferase involved in cell wall biosynthesis